LQIPVVDFRGLALGENAASGTWAVSERTPPPALRTSTARPTQCAASIQALGGRGWPGGKRMASAAHQSRNALPSTLGPHPLADPRPEASCSSARFGVGHISLPVINDGPVKRRAWLCIRSRFGLALRSSRPENAARRDVNVRMIQDRLKASGRRAAGSTGRQPSRHGGV